MKVKIKIEHFDDDDNFIEYGNAPFGGRLGIAFKLLKEEEDFYLVKLKEALDTCYNYQVQKIQKANNFLNKGKE